MVDRYPYMPDSALRILKMIFVGGVFLVPFIPFIVADSLFFPFITGKGFFFRILIEALLAVWAVVAYFDRSYIPRMSWISAAVLAFVGVVGIADALGADPWKSFWSNFERMEGFVLILHLCAYFFVLGAVLRTQRLWERFFQVSLLVSVFMGMYGILQLSGAALIHQGGARLDGSFGNSAYLAVYALAHIFLALFFASRRASEGASAGVVWGYGGIALLNAFVLYFTATRGAILGAIGGIIVAGILVLITARGAEFAAIRKWAAGFLAAVALVIGTFFTFKDTDAVRGNQILGRFASISLEETTTLSRFLIWEMAWQGWKERPLLGWGQENFNLVFNKYYDPKMYAQEPWFDRAHNIFLDWLIAAGALGLAAYLSILIAILVLLWRGVTRFSSVEKSILTGFLAGYMFHNIFVFDHLLSYILFFSIAAFVHAAVGGFVPREEKEERNGGGAHNPHIGAVVAPAAVVGFLVTAFLVNSVGIFTARALIAGLHSYPEGPQKNLEAFTRAASYGGLGLAEVREQAVQTAVKVAYAKGVPEEMKIRFINFAASEIQTHADTHPEDARYQLFAASFFDTVGDYDRAFQYIERARALSPKKQDIFFELVAIHVNRKEYREALVAAKELYEYEPRNSAAQILYGVSAIYARDFALAEELLAPLAPVFSGTDIQRIVSAYMLTKRYDKVADTWKAAVEAHPENTQYRIGLAASYIQIGARSKAVAELKQAIAGNPDFRQLGEYYISEIQAGRNP